MTIHIDAHDIAGLPVRTPGPFGTALRMAAAGARAFWRRFLQSMHDSRRQQAAIELARHRYPIYDPATGVSFGFDATARNSASPE